MWRNAKISTPFHVKLTIMRRTRPHFVLLKIEPTIPTALRIMRKTPSTTRRIGTPVNFSSLPCAITIRVDSPTSAHAPVIRIAKPQSCRRRRTIFKTKTNSQTEIWTRPNYAALQWNTRCCEVIYSIYRTSKDMPIVHLCKDFMTNALLSKIRDRIPHCPSSLKSESWTYRSDYV